MKIKTTITLDDYKTYVKSVRRAMLQHDKSPGKSFFKFVLNMLIFAVIGFVAESVLLKFNIRIQIGSFIAGMLTFVLIFFVVYKFNLKKIRPSHDGILLGEHEYELADECFIDATKLYKNQIKWEGFIKVLETSKYYFLFVDTCSAYIFPKQSFGSEDKENEFRNLIMEKSRRFKRGRPRLIRKSC